MKLGSSYYPSSFFLLWPGAGAYWVSRRGRFSHVPREDPSGSCPKLPNSGFQFPAEENQGREWACSRLWHSASPRAHGLSQAGTKQCHESGAGGRLTVGHGGTSGLGKGRHGRSKVTNREGQLPPLTHSSSWESITEVVRNLGWKSQEGGLVMPGLCQALASAGRLQLPWLLLPAFPYYRPHALNTSGTQSTRCGL